VRTEFVGEKDFVSSVRQADVARWLVMQVEREPAEWVHKCPILGSRGVKWWSLRLVG
jgi:hypothetical protein